MSIYLSRWKDQRTTSHCILMVNDSGCSAHDKIFRTLTSSVSLTRPWTPMIRTTTLTECPQNNLQSSNWRYWYFSRFSCFFRKILISAGTESWNWKSNNVQLLCQLLRFIDSQLPCGVKDEIPIDPTYIIFNEVFDLPGNIWQLLSIIPN